MTLRPEHQPKIAVILGSVTPPGRLRRALGAAVDRGGAGIEAELFDLADHPVSFADGSDPEALGDDTGFLVAKLAAADAVLLATPVYRGSLSGSLKNLIDHVPVAALEGKPVGIVAMGASDHHFLGAERHLRDVLSFFGARLAPVAVYLNSADFDADGEPGERALTALGELLATLAADAAAPPATRPRPLAARHA
jgi:FMN reductase